MWLANSLRARTKSILSSNRPSRAAGKRKAQSRRLRLESLEPRAMLADYAVNATQDGSADAFRLVANGTNVQVYVNETLNQTIPLSGLGKITVTGSSDADTLTIDSSGGPFAVPNGITFNAGGGVNTLVANSQTSNGDIINVRPTGAAAGTISYIAADGTENNLPIVTYTGVQNISLVGQSGEGDTFSVFGTTGNDAFTFNEGASAGTGTVAASLAGGAYALPAITFSGMSATSENVINNSSTTSDGGGQDTLTFNATSSADTLALTPAFDDGMFIAANTGGDRVKVRADNMTQLTVNSLDGNDTINLSSGANVSTTIDGGNGADAIHVSNSPDPDVTINTTAKVILNFGPSQVHYTNVETADGAQISTLPLAPVPGVLFWVDASMLNLSNGAAVTSVSDLSGNGNNLTAIGTGATFNAAALNGKGTIHFSGGVNCLQSINNLGIVGSTSRSIFVVMRYNGGNRMIVRTGVNVDKSAFGIETGANATLVPFQYNYDVGALEPRPAAGTYRIFEATHALSNHVSTGYIDGVLQGTITKEITTANAPVVIGQIGNGYLDGDLAEVLIYNSVLSDIDRQTIEGYLNAKWFSANNAPTLDAISSPATILKNSGLQTISLTGISAGVLESQALQVTATSDNTSLIPTPAVNYTSPNSTGSLSYTPAAGNTGVAHITVVVRDAGLDGTMGNTDDGTVSRTFTVTVDSLPVAGSALWLDATNNASVLNGSGSQATTGQTVANWNNIAVGASGAVSQSTVANQPLYGSHTLNGKPMIYFDGSNDSLSSLTTYANTGTTTSLFMVVRRTLAAGNYRRLVSFVGPNSNTDWSDVGNWCFSNGQSGTVNRIERVSAWDIGTAPAINTAYLAEVVFDGSNVRMYVNGVQQGSTQTTSGNFNINRVTIGTGWTSGAATSENFQGDIGEVLVFNSALGTTDRQLIESYLTNKWLVANVAPTLNAISNPAAINENAGQQIVSLSNITAGSGESQTLQVTATSDNTSLIPNPTVTYTSPNTTGSIAYTPVANAYGTANVTVTVRDAGPDGTMGNADDATFARSFAVAVIHVNQIPTLAAISDPAAIYMNAGQQTVVLTGISAGPGDSQTLQVTATSDNTSVIPNPTVTYTSPNTTGSIAYTPVTYGTAHVTVTVRDAGLDGTMGNSDDATFTRSFVVVVNNTNVTINAAGVGGNGMDNATADAFRLALNSGKTSVEAYLNGTFSQSFPLANLTSITIAGSGDNDTLTIDDTNGLIALTGGIIFQGGAGTNQLVISGGSTNATEIYDAGTSRDTVTDASSNVQIVNFTGAQSVRTTAPVTSFTVNGTSINNTINYTQGSTSAYGQVAVDAYAPVEFSNKASLTILGGAGTDTIALNNPTTPTGLTSIVVNTPPVNHTPTLSDISNPAALELNAGQQTVAILGIGDNDGGTQSLQVTATSDNTGLIPNPTVTYTSPNATGSIAYTPVGGQVGTAHVTVTVRDSGLDGTLGNGDDLLVSKSFIVVVNAPTPPVAGPILWLDASTLKLADGAAVSGMTDWSASHNNAVNYDAADKPYYDADGLNGKGTVHFSGGTEGFVTQSNLGIANGDSRSVFVVMRRMDNSNMIVTLGETDLYKGFGLTSQPDGLHAYVVGQGGVDTAARPGGTYEVYDYLHDGVDHGSGFANILYNNGVLQGTGYNGPDINTTNRPLQIGYRMKETPTSQFDAVSSNGDLAEILIYNRLLSDAERTQIEQYLTNKWIPTNHTPTLNDITNPAAIEENAGLQTVSLAGIADGDAGTQSLSVTATSDNTGLIPNPTVNYTSPNATGSISYTPVANQNGTAHVTVTVRDAGLDGVLGNSDDLSIAKSFPVIVNASVTFPSGMILHLDASTLSLANGAAVTGLTDLSSVHNDAVVTGTPTFNAAGLNGMGTINISGNEGLRTMNNLGISGGTSRSVFMVLRRNGDASTGSFAVQMGNSTSYEAWGLSTQPDWFGTYTNGIGGATGAIQTAGVYKLYDSMHQNGVPTTGGTNYLYVNGGLAGTGTNTPDIITVDSPLYIGTGPVNSNVNGDFAEVLVFNRYLSDAERLSVETYLMNKWFPVTSTASMPEGLVLQLDASTMSLANGAAVTSMTDLSSAHNNMVAAGTGGTFAVDGSGLKSVHFSGGVNGLKTASNMSITGNASRTMMGVLAFQSGRIAVSMGTGGSNQSFGISTAPDFLEYYQYNNDIRVDYSPLRTQNVRETYQMTRDSATNTTKGYLNGALQGSLTSTINTPAAPLTAGVNGNGYAEGNMSEMLVFNRLLSDVERGQVESYLHSKWIALSGGSSGAEAGGLVAETSGSSADDDILIVNGRAGTNDAITVTSTGNNVGTVNYNTSGVPNVTYSALKAITLSGQSSETDTFSVGGSDLGQGQDAVTINDAKLQLSAGHVLASTLDVNITGTGSLDLGGQTVTLSDVTLTSGSIANGTLIGASLNVQSGTVTATLQSTTGLTKSATGTTTLSATNTYAGDTVVSGGQLNVSADNALPANTTLVVGSNGTVVLSSSLTKAVRVKRLVMIVDSSTAAPQSTQIAAKAADAPALLVADASPAVNEVVATASVSSVLDAAPVLVQSQQSAATANVFDAVPLPPQRPSTFAATGLTTVDNARQLELASVKARDAAIQADKWTPTANAINWLGEQADLADARRTAKKRIPAVKAADAVFGKFV